jgi:DNA invertase Pin-like site-specific DNA recombinase
MFTSWRRSPATMGAADLGFNVLAMVAEFEADLIRLRTREGMKVAKAKGRLRGKQPKLKLNQAKHLLELRDSGSYTEAELIELFGVGRSTVYRTIERMRPRSPEPERPFAHFTHRYGSDAHAPEGKA